MKRIIAFVFLVYSTSLLAQNQWSSILASYAKTSAVTGREEEAAEFIQSLFATGIVKKDNLGNLVITVGSGSPKRLFAVPIDEPGYVVSAIKDDGYLKITPVGYGQKGTLFHQFLEGNEIKINTTKGPALGVAIVPSAHYEGLRAIPENSRAPYQWQEAVIDVGASSAGEVAERGIQLLDPLTANKKVSVLRDQFISAPAMRSKAAVVALATVANTLLNTKFKGTVVVAFTTLELLNGKGIESVVTKNGPFDEVIRFNRFLNEDKADFSFRQLGDGPAWGAARLHEIGLPSKFNYTPVELVSFNDVEQLTQKWLGAIEQKTWKLTHLKMPPEKIQQANFQTSTKESDLLSKLVAQYGVSESEKPVRDFILTQMPSWAKPAIDQKGNIVLTFGSGKQHIAFVAHMDEVGYAVDSIRNDGRIVLTQRGGLFSSVWEGHAAVIHGDKDIQGIFEPRANYLTATTRPDGDREPVVYAGFNSKEEAVKAGIKEHITTVTMPKGMIRLTENKATARGFDDRVGCATLLMALQNIKPETLPFKVTFVWAVEEETGLVGSTFSAKNLKDLSIVYPIDTFVSSDDPVDPRIFGYCPLGNGAVIRVIESINIVGRSHLGYLQKLAAKNNIKTQYGITAGGTDGQAFLSYDIPSVPLSWPGRYSHSPVEIMDFRDMNNLVKLVQAIINDTEKTY